MLKRPILALFLLCSLGCDQGPRGTAGAGTEAESTGSRAPTSETGPGRAAEPPREIAPGSHGVYVPAYSHIYHHRDGAFLLTATLSIRNTDVRDSLTITSVRYYDTGGALVRSPLTEPRTLGPLESMEIIIEERDVSGGSGANFIVEWRSETPVNPPIMETVMISTAHGQGISFTSRGVPIGALEEGAR